jgi:hypothetical protein
MTPTKTAISAILLSIFMIVIPFFIITNYFGTTTFAREGITKGVLRRYQMDTKSGSYFTYSYTLDREYVGYTDALEGLKLGDTIDVIYDLSDSTRPYSGGFGEEPPSYSAVSRYVPILGIDYWAFKMKYKKYLDKIKSSKDSKNKYLGILP